MRKKDGTDRLCTDYRALNRITKKDQYPTPNPDEIFDQINGSEWFSTLDLKSGFFQIPLRKEDRYLTAFATSFKDMLWPY